MSPRHTSATLPTKVVSIDALVTTREGMAWGMSASLSGKQIGHEDATAIRETCDRMRRLMLTDADRKQIERWARGRTTPQRVALRSRIVLLAAGGLSVRQVAAAARTSVRTVLLWRSRFARDGLQSLLRDAPGRGRKPAISPEIVRAIAEERSVSGGAGRAPTMRAVAQKFGVSRSTVHRIWSRDGFRDGGNSGTTR